MSTPATFAMHSKPAPRIGVARSGFAGNLRPIRSVAPRPIAARPSSLVVRADRDGGSFWPGFMVGGVVCGVLGFVFAPQISRALLGEEQRLRLPRFLEEENLDPEVTKQNLAEKIAQLNAAIDDVSSQLKSQETVEEAT